jgi:hypothetical protein
VRAFFPSVCYIVWIRPRVRAFFPSVCYIAWIQIQRGCAPFSPLRFMCVFRGWSIVEYVDFFFLHCLEYGFAFVDRVQLSLIAC